MYECFNLLSLQCELYKIKQVCHAVHKSTRIRHAVYKTKQVRHAVHKENTSEEIYRVRLRKRWR